MARGDARAQDTAPATTHSSLHGARPGTSIVVRRAGGAPRPPHPAARAARRHSDQCRPCELCRERVRGARVHIHMLCGRARSSRAPGRRRPGRLIPCTLMVAGHSRDAHRAPRDGLLRPRTRRTCGATPNTPRPQRHDHEDTRTSNIASDGNTPRRHPTAVPPHVHTGLRRPQDGQRENPLPACSAGKFSRLCAHALGLRIGMVTPTIWAGRQQPR